MAVDIGDIRLSVDSHGNQTRDREVLSALTQWLAEQRELYAKLLDGQESLIQQLSEVQQVSEACATASDKKLSIGNGNVLACPEFSFTPVESSRSAKDLSPCVEDFSPRSHTSRSTCRVVGVASQNSPTWPSSARGSTGSFHVKIASDVLPDELGKPTSMLVSPVESSKTPNTEIEEEFKAKDTGSWLAATHASLFEKVAQDEFARNYWRRCSGLHTVDEWVLNYKKHKGGWAALLLIHGADEVCSRLRNKVENYCIYSALFLSMSLAMIASPSEFWMQPLPEGHSDSEWWSLEIRKRLYMYGFAVGSAAHTLCLMLGMSFVNALNETARDSDVFRMFARGKGYMATVKCQQCFRIGWCADYIAIATSCRFMISWVEIIGFFFSLCFICVVAHWRTANLLFQTSSIQKYWRPETGGKPDEDDPYDLKVPVEGFRTRAKMDREFVMRSTTSAEGDVLHSKTPSRLSSAARQCRESHKRWSVFSGGKRSSFTSRVPLFGVRESDTPATW